jgi:thioredoxin 2
MSPDAAGGIPALARCSTCGTINRVDLARIRQGPKCAKCGTRLALDRPQPVTDGDFQRLVGGASVPVLVDFYADWCGPCRAIAPALEQFAAAEAGRIVVLKLDTDANPETTVRFGVRGIPTLISFRDGKELRRHTGIANRQVLERLMG